MCRYCIRLTTESESKLIGLDSYKIAIRIRVVAWCKLYNDSSCKDRIKAFRLDRLTLLRCSARSGRLYLYIHMCIVMKAFITNIQKCSGNM